MLNRFARWFASAGGVWQTVGAVAMVCVLELTHTVRDDHGFWLLYWLTVYSAATQPILAYANKQDTAQGDLILARIEALIGQVEALEQEELVQLAALLKQKVVAS
jgi:hypothetical protein